ncbi:MAG: ATP-binding cassette domain-containing protein [Candidatus Zophobacter franzmannii]|jgi:phospholipid/cholesterol/gamma-HCH transport system ATP-binding protein|nr:ATP-binding cassette domain-containing protein [Candidatus Zophobacter franzmannii]
MIKVKNLSVSFEEKEVLHNINLELPEGESTVIVGKSGCGKTVLIKSILGLIPFEKGEIEVEGMTHSVTNSANLNLIRKKISMVFQNSALFDSMNVYQNVAFPLVEHTKLSFKEISRIVKEKLKMVGLHDIEDVMPSELSGGMKKRVGLARAIVLEPDYVFYDEPTTGLDPVTADEIITLISKLSQTNRWASVIITHDKKLMKAFPNNIIMLNEGKTLFHGDLDQFNSSDDGIVKSFSYSY